MCIYVITVWLTEGKINRLVLVIQRQDTRETIERWEFDVHVEGEEEQQQQEGEGASSTASNTTTDQPAASTAAKKPGTSTKPKTLAQVQTEIQKIIRQIIATVSFLPIPDTPRQQQSYLTTPPLNQITKKNKKKRVVWPRLLTLPGISLSSRNFQGARAYPLRGPGRGDGMERQRGL